MRETTEGPVGLDAGTARLVGTDVSAIVSSVSNLLTNGDTYRSMADAENPFGDGHAAARSVHALEKFLGLRSDPVEEFVGGCDPAAPPARGTND
jgi:UDP-N-acetylglucosamine 2-epimerase (non-hydrolysing)